MPRRGASRALWTLGALVLVIAGCTSSTDPGPTPSSSTIPATSSASTSPSSSPSASATRVPVDQIPPGNPKTWVPAGVPTVAKYKEPGDVVPMFTQAMFKRTDLGALAMAAYYLQARNWALAIDDARPFSIICRADACTRAKKFIDDKRRLGQYVSGQRLQPSAPTVFKAPSGKDADFVVQLKVTVRAGSLVAATGKTVEKYRQYVLPTNLYLKWTGKLWTVTGDYLVG